MKEKTTAVSVTGRVLTACLAVACVTLAVMIAGLARFSEAEVPTSGTALLVSSAESVPPVPETSAEAYALIDASSLALLGKKNSGVRLPMASTTKIMTALVVLENMALDDVVTVPAEAVGIEGSSLYLQADEKLTVRDLLYGLLLESGNDAACTLAIACAGSEEAFVGRMNGRAAEMGLFDTHFENPHGLTAEGHYTTAYELALITAHALRNETFRQMVSTVRYVSEGTEKTAPRYFHNHNRLLTCCDGAIGVKTGYTKAAGRCLVSAAERENGTFIVVTLHDGNDWADHKKLLDHAFSAYQTVTVAEPGGLCLNRGGKEYRYPDEGVYLTTAKGENPTLYYRITLSGSGASVSYGAGDVPLGTVSLRETCEKDVPSDEKMTMPSVSVRK